MKETTAYMMTEMMKTVLTYGTGRSAYLPWLPQAGKTGTSNYTDEEIENHIKTSQFVAPDEMFVGYTRKYSMAVWTGYTNRLTPIMGDGLTVAARVYRAMMTSLSQNDHPGDWTMPEGLYRNGQFVFQNGARNTWNTPDTQQTVENSSTTTGNSTTQAGQQPNNAPATDPNQGQAGQAGQPTQPVQPTPQNPQVQQPQQ